MRKILFLVAVILGINLSVLAETPSVINGSSSLSYKEYDSLTVNGNLTFNHLRINNDLVINGGMQGEYLACKILQLNGSFSAENFRAEIVKSNGSFIGENIKITGASEFSGLISIKNAKLGSIVVATKLATFEHIEIAGDIIVKKVKIQSRAAGDKSGQPSTQILELKGKNLITGNITFEDEGELHISEDTSVKGTITNAKIIRK